MQSLSLRLLMSQVSCSLLLPALVPFKSSSWSCWSALVTSSTLQGQSSMSLTLSKKDRTWTTRMKRAVAIKSATLKYVKSSFLFPDFRHYQKPQKSKSSLLLDSYTVYISRKKYGETSPNWRSMSATCPAWRKKCRNLDKKYSPKSHSYKSKKRQRNSSSR